VVCAGGQADDAADAVGDAAHAGARVFDGLYGRAVYDALNDGDILSTDEVLTAGDNFLNSSYIEPVPGVFVSREPVDGTDVHAMFCVTDADLMLPRGQPHANFELVRPTVSPGTGRVRYG
jgi:hypothetical protein